MKTENQNEVITFQFSETENYVRSLMINGKPFFVANDVAKTLGYKYPKNAIRQHCKGGIKHPLLTKGGLQETSIIPEGDVFRLIINSELPSAEKFERWVMDEVLPSIRKNGTYRLNQSKKDDYIDLRHIPHSFVDLNGKRVKTLIYENVKYVHLQDLLRSWNTTTCSTQHAKTIKDYVRKFWLYGSTNPAWFVNENGLKLLSIGNRTTKVDSQMSLF